MVNNPVLVLNADYQPFHVCRVRRAVVLVLEGKAKIEENGVGELHTPTLTLPIPSVIRLVFFVSYPRWRRRLTRFEIFNRDSFTCQYCGKQTMELTLDHVIPRYRGGEHTWENVVSACIPCNRRKAGKTPWEAGMRLICKLPPQPYFFTIPYSYLHSHPQWQRFLS